MYVKQKQKNISEEKQHIIIASCIVMPKPEYNIFADYFPKHKSVVD